MEDEYLFTNLYKKGDILFYADIVGNIIRKIKLRTVKDIYMVGVVAKMETVYVGRDKKKWLHKSLFEAKKYFESLGVSPDIEIINDRKERGGDNE